VYLVKLRTNKSNLEKLQQEYEVISVTVEEQLFRCVVHSETVLYVTAEDLDGARRIAEDEYAEEFQHTALRGVTVARPSKEQVRDDGWGDGYPYGENFDGLSVMEHLEEMNG